LMVTKQRINKREVSSISPVLPLAFLICPADGKSLHKIKIGVKIEGNFK